jgi:hypothetical protein
MLVLLRCSRSADSDGDAGFACCWPRRRIEKRVTSND